jgi:hypothetical protein
MKLFYHGEFEAARKQALKARFNWPRAGIESRFQRWGL